MQFKEDYFSFEGIDSRSKDIYIVSTNANTTEYDFGMSRGVVTEEGVGDIPTFIRVKENTFDIELQITKCTKNGTALSFTEEDKYELSRWLVKKNPRPLYVDGMIYYVVAKSAKRWFNLRDSGYITLTFESVSPYCYAPIKSNLLEVDREYSFELLNDSSISEYEFVDIEIERKSGGTYIEIYNEELDETFRLEGLSSNDNKIKIYGEDMLYVENIDKKDKNMRPLIKKDDWLRLVYGVNNITIKTDGVWYVQMTYQEKNPLV